MTTSVAWTQPLIDTQNGCVRALFFCVMSETWWDYVTRISGGAPQNDVAARVGVDPSRPSGWKKGNPPSAQNAVALARAYNRPATEGLVAAGYLHPNEVGQEIEIRASASDLTDEALIKELHSRLLYGSNHAEKWPWRSSGPGAAAATP